MDNKELVQRKDYNYNNLSKEEENIEEKIDYEIIKLYIKNLIIFFLYIN